MPDVEGPLLDVGCGYGPIGLALSKELSRSKVHMVDVNERAIRIGKRKCRLNQILKM